MVAGLLAPSHGSARRCTKAGNGPPARREINTSSKKRNKAPFVRKAPCEAEMAQKSDASRVRTRSESAARCAHLGQEPLHGQGEHRIVCSIRLRTRAKKVFPREGWQKEAFHLQKDYSGKAPFFAQKGASVSKKAPFAKKAPFGQIVIAHNEPKGAFCKKGAFWPNSQRS